MKNEFVPYEQALALKELESDEPYLGECFGEYRQWDGSKPYLQLYQDLDGCSTDPADYEYTTECSAPTYSQAFRWFRKKYKLNSETPYLPNVEKYGIIVSDMTIKPKDLSKNENFKRGVEITNNFAQYDTHEEAELACLKKLIELSTETNKP